MKQTPHDKANQLVEEYEAIIEQHCNQSSKDSHYSAAVESALKTVDQILKLSGLPQFQIVFWREVENELKNKIINH